MLIYSVIGIYLLISFYILYKFHQNNYSIEKTFASIFSCCVKNKKDAEEKIGKQAVKEFEDAGTCHHPKDLLLDICLRENLDPDDMILRKKLKDIISKIDTTVIDNGTPKQKIPLEATIFLTKNLAPLVDEDGNITISLRNNESKELIQAINDALGTSYNSLDVESAKKGLLELKNSLQTHSNVIQSAEKTTVQSSEEINVSAINIEKTPKMEEVYLNEEKDSPTQDSNILNPDDLDLEDMDFKEPEGLNDVEKELAGIDFDKELSDLDMLSDDLEDIDFNSQPEEKEDEVSQETIYDFYCDLPYKTLSENIYFDVDAIEENIRKAFTIKDAKTSFLNNLIKTQPLVFTNNKESFFAPRENVAFAFFKLFGADYKTWLDFFRKTNKSNQNLLFSTLYDEIKELLNDEKSKPTGIGQVVKKDDAKFFSFGYFFTSSFLKDAFTQEEYNFIRSYPYTNDISFSEKQGQESLPKLTPTFADAEIKC